MVNALTIDIEDWYQTQDFNISPSNWDMYEDRMEYGVNIILEILQRHSIKATFFILGYIAKKHPELVRKIAVQGHEIGSHGFYHRMVDKMTKKEFKEDLVSSKAVLEDITGTHVKIYRASSWSVSPDTYWALLILEEEGFICDSSIQPYRTPLSGMRKGIYFPFHPVIDGKKLNLLEYPQTVLKFFGFSFPFSGGFYLRAMPSNLVLWALKNVNTKMPGMVYIHPWELDAKQPRLNVPLHMKFIHYYNLNSTEGKLKKLLKAFKFIPLGELIKENEYPSCQFGPDSIKFSKFSLTNCNIKCRII